VVGGVVMQIGLVVAVSLASALAFAVSSSLKHISAGQVPDAQTLGARSLGRFVRATLAHPLWLGGIGADVLGLGLQVTALHLGALGGAVIALARAETSSSASVQVGHHRIMEGS